MNSHQHTPPFAQHGDIRIGSVSLEGLRDYFKDYDRTLLRSETHVLALGPGLEVVCHVAHHPRLIVFRLIRPEALRILDPQRVVKMMVASRAWFSELLDLEGGRAAFDYDSSRWMNLADDLVIIFQPKEVA